VAPTRSRLLATLTALALLNGPAACRDGGGDVATDEPASTTTPSTTTTTTTATTTATAAGSGGGPDSDLDRRRSDASSDLERRVSATLTDLDAQVSGGDTVISLPDHVLFDFDRHELRPEATPTLDRIAEAVDYFAPAPVRVAGHTDARGSTQHNQGLSERRARSVLDHLVGAGVDPDRLTAEGHGETRPVAPNQRPDGSDDPDGRARNRRVEVVITGVDPSDLDP
jgi:outer membrane protein OmpA-like peptidoglycan-associated protein